MLGFNFLKMENYASYEGFANPKKEKFTADELEHIMNVDNEDTFQDTTDNMNVKSSTSNNNVPDDAAMDTSDPMEEDDNNEEMDVDTPGDVSTLPSEDELEVMAEDNGGSNNDEGSNDDGEVVEGFVGSRVLRRLSLRNVLYYILLVLGTYLVIKALNMYYNRKMKVIYKKLNFIKANKLNLEFDLVLSFIIGSVLFLILHRLRVL